MPYNATDSAAASSQSVNWRPISRPHELPHVLQDSRESLPQFEKQARRESRLGLRSLFSRTRSVRSSDSLSTSNQAAAPSSNRDSMTQGIPYYTLPPGKPTPRNDTHPLSTTFEDAKVDAEPPVSLSVAKLPKRKTGGAADTAPKGHPISWAAAPLHKAYPQAVRHSTLPATTLDADYIVRCHDKTASSPVGADASALPPGDDKAWPKRRNRARSGPSLSIEWTNKTYVLVNAGYLLEYPAEGFFDRPPDKALRLTKDSAVFATDMIPGRHWVLQVASAVSPDGSTNAGDSKSFLSRIPFLSMAEKDRRSAAAANGGDKQKPPSFNLASNILLVLESAEDMDEWLATLRRVIEALGGKRVVSETGNPRTEVEDDDDRGNSNSNGDSNDLPLRAQPSQRTLVLDGTSSYLADHEPAQPAWERELIRRGSDASVPMSEMLRDESMDDASATNSILSHDGQRLESLRSSANRFSCVSSGQRTFITSAGSSPAGSPTRDCFLSSPEVETAPQLRPEPELRLRPNAAAIADRRKSQQMLGPFVELQPAPGARRPQSLSPVGAGPVDLSMSEALSSFSRRFPTRLPGPGDTSYASILAPPPDIETLAARRPPRALHIARPLSMVEDQPSPKEDVPERPATRHSEMPSPTSPESVPLPPSRPESCVSPRLSVGGDERSTEDRITVTVTESPPSASVTRPSAAAATTAATAAAEAAAMSPVGTPSVTPSSARRNSTTSPRRLSSMGTLRMQSDGSWMTVPSPESFKLPRQGPRVHDAERCHSAMDMYARMDQSPAHPSSSPSSSSSRGVRRRVSMMPFVPDHQASTSSSPSQNPPRGRRGSKASASAPAPVVATHRLPPPRPMPSLPLVPSSSASSASSSSSRSSRFRPGSSTSSMLRKSMPHLLTEGPPPGPAPTYALPPVPPPGPPPTSALPPVPTSVSTSSLPLFPPPMRALPPLPPSTSALPRISTRMTSNNMF